MEALSAHAPWKPIEFTPEDVGALQACWRGDAMAHQQKRVVDLVIRVSWNEGAHYFPGDAGRRDTDFALGRAFVGQQLSTMLKFKFKPTGEQG